MVLIRKRNCVVLMLANEGSQWEMTYSTDFLCSHLGKIHKAYLQMERETYDNSSEPLQQDLVSHVSGDAHDFIDEGQEAAWEPTTLGLQKQSPSPAVQDMTAVFHFAVKGRDI